MSYVKKPDASERTKNAVNLLISDANDSVSLTTVFVRNAQEPDDPFLINRIKGIGECKVDAQDGAFRVEALKWRIDLMKQVWPMLEISPKPFL